jgi:hypothetical protein
MKIKTLKQSDMFPALNRTLTRPEAAIEFDRLKAAVAGMTFATDEAQRLCHRGNVVWQRHRWDRDVCANCGTDMPHLTAKPHSV